MTYYNECDRNAAAWLRELIRSGLIAEGYVDERSICDVSPAELAGYDQCHFFAGIGGWGLACRYAGWPDDWPVWTGSCPCQPFSVAGKRTAFNDKRHLWPELFRLIKECKPHVCFGEQVASKDGLAWLDAIYDDLEGAGYAVGACCTPAAGFGAPHIRQRLYWVAYADGNGLQGRLSGGKDKKRQAFYGQARRSGPADGPDSTNGLWRDANWIQCKDGRWRPIEPGLVPLVDGFSERAPLLRGYGNAIVIPQAAAFIEAFLEIQIQKNVRS